MEEETFSQTPSPIIHAWLPSPIEEGQTPYSDLQSDVALSNLWDPVLCHLPSHSPIASCLFLKPDRNAPALGSVHFLFSLKTPCPDTILNLLSFRSLLSVTFSLWSSLVMLFKIELLYNNFLFLSWFNFFQHLLETYYNLYLHIMLIITP